MFSINYKDPRPIYEQVKDNLRRSIITGILEPGEKIPSVRETASELAVNPNTIQRAYRELEYEGYICSVPGKGSFVNESDEAILERKKELFEKLSQIIGELRQVGVSTEEILKFIKTGEAK